MAETHPDFVTVEAWVRDIEGFTAEGDLFPQGRSAAIASLAKQFRGMAFRDVGTADASAALARMPSAKRRGFCSALGFADTLRERAPTLPPEIAACLPLAPLRGPLLPPRPLSARAAAEGGAE